MRTPYSQQYILWRIISAPIRYFLKEQCDKEMDNIDKANEEINMCIIKSRSNGKITRNISWLIYNQEVKRKAERFLMWWG